MKEFIELIKKLWQNKKTKSLAILIVYLIFFVLVFTMIGNTPSQVPTLTFNEKIKNSTIEKLEFIGNYNFIVSNNVITYNENSYDLNNKPIELSNYDINIYTPNNIYNLLENAILETKNYVTGDKTYIISVKDFENIIYKNTIENKNNIRIIVHEENLDILIDLKEYYDYEVKIELRS